MFLLPLFSVKAIGAIDLINQTGVSKISKVKENVPDVSHAKSPTEKVFLVFLALVKFLLYLAGVGAGAMIVVSGIRLSFSAGNEEMVDGARRTLLYAVLGLLAVILSLLIVENIANLFYQN